MSEITQKDRVPSADTAPATDPVKTRFETRVTADSHFSWIRTRLSVERTLMSWVRTASSLIGFGFAIVQFFDRVEQFPSVKPARFPEASRYLGLALILSGVLGLVVSLWQYWWTLRYLRSGSFAPLADMNGERFQMPIVAIAILLAVIGTFAFIAVVTRLV
jgi:putative membrane protein